MLFFLWVCFESLPVFAFEATKLLLYCEILNHTLIKPQVNVRAVTLSKLDAGNVRFDCLQQQKKAMEGQMFKCISLQHHAECDSFQFGSTTSSHL